MSSPHPSSKPGSFGRRRFLRSVLIGGALGGSGVIAARFWLAGRPERTFIAKAQGYQANLVSLLLSGFGELGVDAAEIRGKRILLKPNLVEPHLGRGHINTHPLVVRAAAEAFLKLGAAGIVVAEGPGHRRDAQLVLEQSGMAEVLKEDRIPFVDLNQDTGVPVANAGRLTRLKTLNFPRLLANVDWIVSVAKLKTHHWAGVTLSMKNLFGILPGVVYGWPKNVLHFEGIKESILDINATLRPHLAIVDGIVGMEGDGPILGPPKEAGVLVMGRNLPAVDATCARVMGIDPSKILYLADADNWLGPVEEDRIAQVGEPIATVRSDFALLEHIPAHQGIRLALPLPNQSHQ